MADTRIFVNGIDISDEAIFDEKSGTVTLPGTLTLGGVARAEQQFNQIRDAIMQIDRAEREAHGVAKLSRKILEAEFAGRFPPLPERVYRGEPAYWPKDPRAR